jgi:S1-C subfamily serine protease
MRRFRNNHSILNRLIKALGIVVILGTTIWVFTLISSLKQQNNSLSERLDNIENKLGGSSKITCNENDSIKKARRSVVRVVGGEAEGSGFAMNFIQNTIITNFHVIEFEPSPKVVFPDNTFTTATIVLADKDADIAVLKIDKTIPTLSVGSSDGLTPPSSVFALGYPLGGVLIGETSVIKGSYSARRNAKDIDVSYIQTDATYNGGMSGGPMIDECGYVVGMTTAGTGGLGLGISIETLKEKIIQMKLASDPLHDIVRIDFQPNKSPLDAVTSFYNYLKIRKLESAFALLSDNFLKGGSFAQWKKGYQPLLDTTVIKIETDETKENVVNIKLSTKNLVDDEIQYKYFEGWWEVKKVDGNLKLWQPKIREIDEPDDLWFYE